MDDGGPHVVVAVMRALPMLVLLELQFARLRLARLHQGNPGHERVRLRDLVARFQEAAFVLERELLPAAVRPHGLDGEIGSCRQCAACASDAEARRDVVFENLDRQMRRYRIRRGEAPRLIVGMAVGMTMPMVMTVMVPAATTATRWRH